MTISKSATTLAAAAALLALSQVGQAAPPTQADFDACNKEAQARATSPAASPGTSSTPSTGTSPSSSPATAPSAGAPSDSQLPGIATGGGQSDPAYQQAYRDCLKRRGF